MISQIRGKLIEKKEGTLVIDVHGLYYEVLVPLSVVQRLDQMKDPDGNILLMTYHYFQMEPSRGVPVLVGFLNEIEREFFLQFIKVSGIGPRAAVRALNKPICEITRAIDGNDVNFLKTLPGIGIQRAKEIVAKLQGKIGKFGLIQDHEAVVPLKPQVSLDWQQEALEVLLQLQYKRPEALQMIQQAIERSKDIQTAEDLLNEIYKQRVKK